MKLCTTQNSSRILVCQNLISSGNIKFLYDLGKFGISISEHGLQVLGENNLKFAGFLHNNSLKAVSVVCIEFCLIMILPKNLLKKI